MVFSFFLFQSAGQRPVYPHSQPPAAPVHITQAPAAPTSLPVVAAAPHSGPQVPLSPGAPIRGTPLTLQRYTVDQAVD
jgi:hypothetical protein